MTARERLGRMKCSLEGLSVGDAFGEHFVLHRRVVAELRLRGRSSRGVLDLRQLGDAIRPPPWRWTDDTAMALSIAAILRKYGSIDSSELARNFAQQYSVDPRRGYGPAMHTLLPQLRNPKAGTRAAKQLFSGRGSFGNGASMRVAPPGAYFADNLALVVEQAQRSAEITHAHSEGIAGAVAVALAAALAYQVRDKNPPAHEFLDLILPLVPESLVRNGIRLARDLAAKRASISEAVNDLGNGSEVTAQDTVPFVLWCASQYLNNYEEALWQTVSAIGDMDTNCAIVGGIVSLYTGADAIPAVWIANREALPSWVGELGQA